jgi:flagellar biosynthesis/type III secretory pathway chaperone
MTMPPESNSPHDWEQELGELLALLSSTQGELLALLGEKRELLVQGNLPGLAAIAPREEAIVAQLQICQMRREELLGRAANEGLPNDSLHSLTKALPQQASPEIRASLNEAEQRTRLLRHHSLTNWVLVQRTLLHLSQMLEIIATGGQPQPTYGKGAVSRGGSLVDQAA